MRRALPRRQPQQHPSTFSSGVGFRDVDCEEHTAGNQRKEADYEVAYGTS